MSVINSLISSNNAASGSGIYSRSGVVNVVGSVFNDNSGNAITGFYDVLIDVVNSTFTRNGGSAVSGGAYGRTSVVGSTIINNAAGINSEGVLMIDRSIISNNCCFGGVFGGRFTTISNTAINNSPR